MHVFRPSVALPVYTHENVFPARISAAAFVPSGSDKSPWLSEDPTVEWMKKSRLFFISEKMVNFMVQVFFCLVIILAGI